MPLTVLDPAAALVLVDLQKGIVGLPTAHPSAPVVAQAAALARAFRKRQLPVVLVNVAGRAPGRTDQALASRALPPDWTEIVAELDPQPTDLRITKHCYGAFLGTALDAELRSRGVTQIVLAGVATSIGVESTARSAFDLGYNVVLVADAMTDMRPEAHTNSIEIIFPRLGEVCSTADLLARLES